MLIQSGLVCLKVDGIAPAMEWKVVLFPSWVIIIVMTCYSLGIGGMLICITCSYLDGVEDSNQGKRFNALECNKEVF